MYMYDIKLFDKIEKIKNPDIGSKNMQSGYRDGLCYRHICHANNEKSKTTNDWRKRTTKSRKTQKAGRTGNLLVLGIIGSRHYSTSGEEKENFKE